MSQTISITDYKTNWPQISLAKEFILAEKSTLKKIIKIFLCIILSPFALFLDISHNIFIFFKPIKKDTQKLLNFIEKIKYIWIKYKKILIVSFIAIGTSISCGYLYYSIKPLFDLNNSYDNCQKNAWKNITFYREQADAIQKSIQEQIHKTSIFDRKRLNSLDNRAKNFAKRTQGEINAAQPEANKKLAICKKQYEISYKNLSKDHNLLRVIFNFYKYQL